MGTPRYKSMKPSLLFALSLTGLFSASPLLGQIKDDKGSHSKLAVQCLISARQAGRTDVTLADYDQYATSLAKTISFLSAEQQGRVFGSVSGGGIEANDSAESSPARQANSAGVESGAFGLLSDVGNAIVDSVGDFNAFMTGTSADAPMFLGVPVELGPGSDSVEPVGEGSALLSQSDVDSGQAPAGIVKVSEGGSAAAEVLTVASSSASAEVPIVSSSSSSADASAASSSNGSKNKSKNVPNGNAFGWWKKNGDTAP